MTEALEAAHERGVVHRDLKPGNIMLATSGKVKVLDFGLAKAKALDTPGSGVSLSNSPTMLTAGGSQPSGLIGTAAYMSPEQVRGQLADERSDVWAFGCVLYEMLTSRQPFTGETITDLIGGIVRVDPDWNALPASTPSMLRGILRHCLQKDRRRRFRAIGDVGIELEELHGTPAPAIPVSKTRKRMVAVIAAVLVLITITAILAGIYFRPAPAQLLASRFEMELPLSTTLLGTAAPFPTVSPDGRYVAFVAVSPATVGQLWIRSIGVLTAQPIAGADVSVPINGYPFWSPDSRFIAFFSGGKLQKLAIGGGPSQILCDASSNPTSGTWNKDDVILFEHQGSIHRVAAAGGVSTPVRTPDKSKKEVSYKFPSFLPDGRSFVYVAVSSESGRTEVRAGALNTDSNLDKPLFSGNSRVRYADPGYLLFIRAGTLMAQPFDARRLLLTGDSFPVAGQVAFNANNGNAAFDVSGNGTLVYRAGNLPGRTEITWFDRSGKKIGVVPVDGNFTNPNLSPDQNRIAVEKLEGSVRDIWLIDLVRGTTSRFTFDAAIHQYPVFSPDGQQVLFVSDRSGSNDLYMRAANGVGEEKLLLKKADGVSDWSTDGKTVLYAVGNPFEVWALPMTGDKKPYPLVNQKFRYIRAKFSPDGRWFAYTSNESGRDEIYVQTFPPSGGKSQVSVNGGAYAYWRRDGKEIIFGTGDRKIMAVDVKLATSFEAGVPRQLFEIPETMAGVRFAITADAQRFLIPLLSNTNRSTLTTVLNWTADIKK